MSTLAPIRARLLAAYSPEAAEAMGHELARQIGAFLHLSSLGPVKETPPLAPAQIVATMRDALKAPMGDDVSQVGASVALFLRDAMRLHAPHYMGHQVPPPLPLASLLQAVVGIANQGTAIFEMSPSATAAEKAMIAALLPYLGWQTGVSSNRPDGILTNGGTLANMTALLTARNVRYGDGWQEGLVGSKVKPAIIASADSHYSISRAAGTLGIGTANVIKGELDAQRRLCPKRLREALRAARNKGLDVFALVAVSGSTPIGAFDNLRALSEVAAEFNLWLHVDAAHGGGLLLSKTHRVLLQGIEFADSVTWDAHKMLFMPSLSTFLFYRNRLHSFKTFAQDAPYLLDSSDAEKLDLDAGLRTLECTRQAFVLGLWACWRSYGPDFFADLVDLAVATTQEFYEMIQATDDFEALHEPQANILCFRYVPARWRLATPEMLSHFQLRLRQQLNDNGDFYITGTTLDGHACLRVTLMNPRIERQHLEGLLAALRRQAAQLEKEYRL